MNIRNGFSLVEVMVTITILTLLGVAVTTIITRSFQGNTKTELIGNVKNHGQAALAVIERDIRQADTVVCPSAGTSNVLTILTKTEGKYIRFSMVPESGSVNGGISKEELTFQVLPNPSSNLCVMATYPLNFQGTQTALTDSTSAAAVSLKDISGNGFEVVKSPGFKDTVKVKFDIGPKVGSGVRFEENIGASNNSFSFLTTVQTR